VGSQHPCNNCRPSSPSQGFPRAGRIDDREYVRSAGPNTHTHAVYSLDTLYCNEHRLRV
jgi:hypothetical protein